MKPYAPIGTVIERTIVTKELNRVFSETLQDAMRMFDWQGMTDQDKAFAEYGRLISAAWNSDDAGYLEDLFDALDDFSPPYSYFGAHEGDGADYGWWPMTSDDSLADARESGYRIEINDHGNVTLYDAHDREVWSVV